MPEQCGTVRLQQLKSETVFPDAESGLGNALVPETTVSG